MVRGYQRRATEKQERELDKWRRLRILAVLQLNAHRGENDAALTPEEWMPLPGDSLPKAPLVLSPEQVEAEYAHTATLDADLN